MPPQVNKTILLRAMENWNNPAVRDDYFSFYDNNVVIHGFPPGLSPGVAGLRQFYRGLWSAFPDARVVIEDVVAENDKLAARYTFTGTHQGNFMGVPATGKQVEMAGITVIRMRGGKCVERWNQGDLLGLMQQLGAIPG